MRPESLITYTAPASEPITRTEAKLQARIETDADDSYVDGLIVAARQIAETQTNRRLISQTLEAQYKDWPEAGFDFWLPGPPLSSVTHVKYYDADGTQQTLSTDVYEVNTAYEPGRISLKPNQSWPTLQGDKATPITIRYVAGYADADAVPDAIKIGMYMLISHWYKNRENAVNGSMSDTPMGAETLFGHYAAPWGY